MAKYEIGFKKGKTKCETSWKVWFWIKSSENNIFRLIGKLFRRIFLKEIL